MTRLEPQEQFEYHKHTSVYISDYIKFADTKAGVAISVTGLLIAFSFITLKNKVSGKSIYTLLTDWSFYPQLLSILLLAYGLKYLLFTIWPRYLVDKNIYHSWGGIGAFSKSSEYIEFLDEKIQDKNQFLNEFAEQNHALAVVCVKKYSNLKPGFFWIALGAIIGGVGWFFG
jgi:hypothetical protein